MTNKSIPSGALKLAKEAKNTAGEYGIACSRNNEYDNSIGVARTRKDLFAAIDRLAALATQAAPSALVQEQHKTAGDAGAAAPVAPSEPVAVGVLRVTDWPTAPEWGFDPVDDLRTMTPGTYTIYAGSPPMGREREPLTEDKIMNCWEGCSDNAHAEVSIIGLARAIEAAHGITAASQVEPEEKHGQ